MIEGRQHPHGDVLMAANPLRAVAWAKTIDDWKRSGLSLPKFCRLNGIKKGTMSGWVYKPALRRAIETARRGGEIRDHGTMKSKPAPAPTPSPTFVPVRLRELISLKVTEPIARSAIEVIVGAGRRVSVERGFDPETLRQVLVVLEAGSC
jgi:hypothetical protein